MGFRQAKLPRNAGVLDAGLRRGACAAIETADEHNVGMRFGYARRDRANAHFGNELDTDARVMIGVLQIVNQLSQVFDRVNVVVRWWRNQAYTRRGKAHACDLRIDLSAR